MNKRYLMTVVLVIFAFIAAPLRGADASYKHWRNSLKAAEQARYKRDFESMRKILEESASEAQQFGPLSSAENSFWLAIAYLQSNMDAEALKTYDSELQRIGPNPTALKVQIIRGLLLTQRGLLYFRLGEYDNAMASANEGKAVLESAAGKFHPMLYEAHRTIGRIYALKNNVPEAEKSMRTALRLAETRATAGDADMLGAAQETIVFLTGPLPARVTLAATDLGRLLVAEGKFQEAEESFKKALENAESVYAKDNVMRAIPLQGLAEVEYQLNHTKQFEKYTTQLFEIVSKNPGYEMAYVKPLWLKFKTEIDQHSPRSIDTLKMIERVIETQHFEFSELGRGAMSISTSGEQVDWKRAEAAEAALLRLADGYTPAAPEKAGLIVAEIANFAVVHDKAELADAMYARMVESQKNAPDKGMLIAALGKLAERKVAEGKKADAAPLYHEVTVAMRQKYGNDMRVADAIDMEAGLMKELGDEDGANKLKAEAMNVRKKAAGQ
jgi:tetratricopeptide (TPR) repeat protein